MTAGTVATPVVPPVTPITVTPAKTGWWVFPIAPLIIFGLFAAAAVYEIDSLVARLDAANASKYASALAIQATQTKTLQDQLAADSAASALRDAGYQKTIAQLSQSISARNAQNIQQQKVDSTLDATTAAQRLTLQTKAGINEVSTNGNNVVVDLPIARNLVEDLDAYTSTLGDLADTQKQLASQTNLTADAKKEAADAESVVASQGIQLVDSTKSCNAQVASVKAAARKSKFKYFGVGYVLGFISGVLVHGV